jgi:predicted nucleotidyltransferase
MISLANTASVTKSLTEILAGYGEVQAAALYGSVARGDHEPHSDVDLLVVCSPQNEEELHRRLTAHLSKQIGKLSLSIYTPQGLHFLARARSLFLLHLKQEALLLFDRSGFLRDALAGLEARESYESDFRKSLELATPLKTAVSGAPNELHRLAYIYSLFRVYGVYLLAERGIYEFSKVRMSAALAQGRPTQASNIALLSSLRVLNANFFSGGEPTDQPIAAEGPSQLQASARALGELVGRPLQATEHPYSWAVLEFAKGCSGRSMPLDFGLRSWFLLLVYDGLNLYCRKHGRSELTSFREAALTELDEPALPKPVRAAAAQSVDYLKNYHRKYMLSQGFKISSDRACHILNELAAAI